jgi:predicted CopG family antitoxin
MVEMENIYKSIRIREETYQDLKKLGSLQDTYDSVISDLIKRTQKIGDP